MNFGFWPAFWGILSGIIVGAIIDFLANFLIDHSKECKEKKNRKKNFKFELDYNVAHVDKVLKEMTKYRNAANGDKLYSFYWLVPLSRVLSYTVNSMFQDGSIYDLLENEDIARLYEFFSDFSIGTENYLRDQLRWNKGNWEQRGVKQKTIADIDFWEGKFSAHKKSLKGIKSKVN